MNALSKAAIQTIPLGTLLFAQNLIALIMFIPMAIMSKHNIFRTQRFSLHFLRAITGLLSFSCLFISIKYIPLLDATLLVNSAPLFLPIIAILWTKEHVTRLMWTSLILGFIGVFFIINPSGDLLQNYMVFIALLGGLFAAIAFQSVRNLKTTDSVAGIIIYYFLISTIFTIPMYIAQYKKVNLEEMELLIGIGIFFGLGQLFLAQAYKYASPTLLGPFNYSVVVFAGLIQWWVWHIIPTNWGFFGIALIIFAGMLTLFQQKNNPKNLPH